MANEVSRKQPEWTKPTPAAVPVLKLYNSLTRSKTEFVPKRGRSVNWYNCGPTVYDASHMGHARTYLSMDIIRRVLEDYFKYDVLFIQNVTDIDDKIILRARQQHLFEKYKSERAALDADVIQTVEQAWTEYATAKLAKVAGAAEAATSNWAAFHASMTPEAIANAVAVDEKYKMYLSALSASHDALTAAKQQLAQNDASKAAVDQLLDQSQDILSVSLDAKFGSQVNDPKVFRDLPAYWEDKYFEDMEALNVRKPDIQTRVSEYVPEIIEYVQKIIDNGYAYEAQGSVYFDTKGYDGHNGHHYAKLEPWSKGNQALIQDGEGSLGANLRGQKSENDFALWKKSKPGEPEWDSPWGPGRPGWHIECSVMAGAVVGDSLDIHSGGIDLAFPHHDNEIAQAEGYYDCHQWVDYFLHTGHLHVEGQKMSKSLKNFISIQEALKQYSSRQLRLFFLQHQWSSRMDFKQSSMIETIQNETTMQNFFDNAKGLLHKIRQDGSRGATALPNGSVTHRFGPAEVQLLSTFQQKQANVHAALCDSINTATAMDEIMSLITQTNKYLAGGAKAVNPHLLTKVASWVTTMMKIFGVADNGVEIGFGSAVQGGSSDDAVMPYLHAMSSFRDDVRRLARDRAPYPEILTVCDKVRDETMVDLGVSLDDQDDGTALVKLVPREVLVEAREKKLAVAAEKRAKQAAQAAEKERKRLEKLERGKVAPQDMFKASDEFSKLDDQGVPTHMKDGEEVTKSRRKKLQKEWDTQKKLHEQYLKETAQ
ncbi:cysteinyl-tRNA synthetase [Gongronella butleri]|nr:cysteinyl-tRNA synthetase [Gongronella butleri]